MIVFIVILIICAVVFVVGIGRSVSRTLPQRLTEAEKKQLPFMCNPELMDYINRNGGKWKS